ncbi:hypothetical protein JTE90_003831 [Oedothorax gibbosus]|uniref:Protein broad-minded n=1 Tax=Oedothorax gibbosus TaxID=931172 RepID=A0AAV6VGD9_9ARAC|nr:hypothetical protein JTE90_003831 [Oedothorax gibbosus]
MRSRLNLAYRPTEGKVAKVKYIKMDYKTLVNKESFKTLLIHHLKSQVKTKYGHSISNKIQESFDKEDSTSTNHVVSSISNDILESESFPQFVNSFLENINLLLKDKESYVPEQEKPGNSSQCSSASSVNGSSIDFLSPDQFAVVTKSLKSGTNAEKLEALGTLYRLPTLEHLTHHFLWVEVENGLHEALSSPIIFLRVQSLRLYIKMLTCTEAKVVLESYQSLIKFFLKVFLPELDQTEADKCRCAIEIISILNKFLQNISTHWLRYPQSMIESITTQSLEILSAISESENSFPTWTCIAMCDPEAKWLKSLLHGHVSRASLLNALKEKHVILHFVLEVENNILDISVAFLNKPVRNIICSDVSAYEAYLNILLEKILKDIKIANSVCPVDLSILSRSLSSALGTKFIMNQAFIFRLSSIIWQLKDKTNDLEDMFSLKLVLETLLPAVFCDLPLSENTLSNTDPILCLFHQVLMLTGASIECVEQEDYIVLALQIISLLCTSVHSVCMLESEFKLTKLLLERQSQYPLIDNKESIDGKPLIDDKRLIDPISMLQNHILVKMNAFGGSGEKILPLEMLDNSDDVYNSPFLMELPLPGNFYHCHPCENDVLLADEHEIVDFKNDFISIMQSKSQISPNLIYQFIEKSLGSLQSDINYLQIMDPVVLDDFGCTLHKTELVGSELVKRYGIYLKLISDVDSSKLEWLLKSTKCLIKNEESKKLDIFACSIYLMCKGNVDMAWSFLQNFTKSSASLFVWTEYQAYISDNFSSDSIPIQSVICELCDIIVKQSLPELYSAMQFRGITPSLIFTYWSQQCYWNYLDFAEISHFVLLNVLFSGQFTLYFFVAVLKHMQNVILDNAHNPELFRMLLKGPIQNFKVDENLNYMMELSDTFHETINMHFLNIVRDQIDS